LDAEKQVSVVIPVLNGAACLPACLAALRAVPVAEIIVVDGGSTDAGPAIAAALGARVLTAPPGRGYQMRAGAAAASQDWLLFLHADTILAGNWRASIAAANPATAGYFRLRLASPRRAARLLEAAAALRGRLLSLPYGDQALLIHRDLLTKIGGVPALALMEDVVLARRLGRRRLALLDGTAETSAARYESSGYLRRPLRNLCCLALFFAGVPIPTIQKLYG
jgi:rSAM/selenodomain-associated transferase 2